MECGTSLKWRLLFLLDWEPLKSQHTHTLKVGLIWCVPKLSLGGTKHCCLCTAFLLICCAGVFSSETIAVSLQYSLSVKKHFALFLREKEWIKKKGILPVFLNKHVVWVLMWICSFAEVSVDMLDVWREVFSFMKHILYSNSFCYGKGQVNPSSNSRFGYPVFFPKMVQCWVEVNYFIAVIMEDSVSAVEMWGILVSGVNTFQGLISTSLMG